MGGRFLHTAGIQKEVIRALLANSPAVMDIAGQLDITPREVREILHEALLHFDNVLQANDALPAATCVSADIPPLGDAELHEHLSEGYNSRR